MSEKSMMDAHYKEQLNRLQMQFMENVSKKVMEQHALYTENGITMDLCTVKKLAVNAAERRMLEPLLGNEDFIRLVHERSGELRRSEFHIPTNDNDFLLNVAVPELVRRLEKAEQENFNIRGFLGEKRTCCINR